MISNPIRRRDFLAGVLGLAAASATLLASPRALAKATRPNFVFILSDDQGWTGSSVSMHDQRTDAKSDYYLTPNLERLASRGVRFSQGYAPAALCCPTRRALQFGQTPARQGEERFRANYRPDDGRLTIPRMLKSVDPGYAAAHFGKWDLRSGLLPEHLGYDESDGDTGNEDGNEGSGFGKEERWSHYAVLDDPKRVFSLTDRATHFMEKQVAAGRPFYVQISHYAVHVDVQARPETLGKNEARKHGTIHRDPAFAAMTEDLDTGLGKVLDMLDTLGIADSTYVIYMADNGAVPWVPPDKAKLLADPATVADLGRNHPLRSGKWTLFEGGIRVPFIVRGPGAEPGAFCDVPVVGWDLLPTIADWAGYGAPLPKDLDGVSFRPLLEHSGEGTVHRPFAGLVFHHYADGYPHSAIRMGDYKLIKFWERPRSPFEPRVTNEELLFNLKEDIGETHNLTEAQPEKAQELRDALMQYLESVNAEVLGKNGRNPGTGVVE